MNSEIGIIERLKEYLGTKKDICFAFLFGSYATGKTFKESDVDIAIYLKEGYSFRSIKNIWMEVERIVDREVDLLVLNTAPPLIGYAAIRGKAIIINDYSTYLDYMLRISQEAEDFREFFTDMFMLREKLREGVK